MFFASNVSSKAQSWELDCPTDECLDNENQPWDYPFPPTRIYYNGPESPDCWVEVIYRKRNPHPNCPNSGCEIEIDYFIVSGACFYPYTEPTPPYTMYPPLMNYMNDQDMWTKSMLIFIESGVEPCINPPEGECITIEKFKSASCKKVTVNPDSTAYLERCEDYNSCCQQILTICREDEDPYDIDSVSWETDVEVLDSCYLNNDSDCQLNCFDYGHGGWIPPKIIINKEEELTNNFKFSYINNKLNYDVGNAGYMLIISSIEGYELYNGYIENKGEININIPNNKIVLKVFNDKISKTIKLIKE